MSGTTAKQDQDFINDMIPYSFLEDAIVWITGNMGPGDIFPPSDLEAWAEENGYTKDNQEEE